MFSEAIECRAKSVKIALHEHQQVIDGLRVSGRVRSSRRPGGESSGRHDGDILEMERAAAVEDVERGVKCMREGKNMQVGEVLRG